MIVAQARNRFEHPDPGLTQDRHLTSKFIQVAEIV